MNSFIGKVLLAAAAAVTLVSCATMSSPLEGAVVDSTTGKPIADAFVIIAWSYSGGDMVGSRSSCPHMEIVRTDAGGRYQFPRQPYSDGGRMALNLFVYVPKYERDYSVPDEGNRRFAMKAFTGNGDTRNENFNSFGSLIGCGSGEDKYTKLIPLYAALDKEFETLILRKPGPMPRQTYSQGLERSQELYLERKAERRGEKQ